jgi:general nucleoside transport system ATP-binding protein
LRQLARKVSILYISHKLHEIQSLCDHATILRNGRVTGKAVPREETPASLARMMIGRELPVCEAPTTTGENTPGADRAWPEPRDRHPRSVPR